MPPPQGFAALAAPRGLFGLMVGTDVALLGYWLVTALAGAGMVALPPEWLYSDYANPAVVAWNWSFMPLDVVFSCLGLLAAWRYRRGHPGWRELALLSLPLTSTAGLMAVSYWAIRAEFDPAWWLANLFLLVWPLPYILHLVRAPRG